jgi:hypothetical protein
MMSRTGGISFNKLSIVQIHTDLIRQKMTFYFLGITILLLIIGYGIQISFINATIYYNTYASQLTFERSLKLYERSKRYQLAGYLFIPIYLILKIAYNTFWLTIFLFFSNNKVSFKNNFNICLKAEYVFVIMLFVKFIFLLFVKPVTNLSDLNFVPGSLITLFPENNLPKWLLYPLQTINIWEILFCSAGSLMLAVKYQVSMKKAVKSFCIPYLTGLFFWMLIVIFFTLQFS